MKLLKETTVWKMPTPSHIYIFDGDNSKIAGYIKEGTKKAIPFSKPMMIDKRHRTFKVVSASGFDLTSL